LKVFTANILLIVTLLSVANTSFAVDVVLSKQAVIEKARSHVQGRVLAADLQSSKPPRYKVKVLQADGRLKVLHLHAKTGDLLGPREK
jgi:uncharacterized membrane protein YkoI